MSLRTATQGVFPSVAKTVPRNRHGMPQKYRSPVDKLTDEQIQVLKVLRRPSHCYAAVAGSAPSYVLFGDRKHLRTLMRLGRVRSAQMIWIR